MVSFSLDMAPRVQMARRLGRAVAPVRNVVPCLREPAAAVQCREGIVPLCGMAFSFQGCQTGKEDCRWTAIRYRLAKRPYRE